MELTIYKRTVCPNCAQIMAIMDAKKMPYKVVNIDEDHEAFNMVKERGFKSAPVLLIHDDEGNEVDNASGKAIMEVMQWHAKGWI